MTDVSRISDDVVVEVVLTPEQAARAERLQHDIWCDADASDAAREIIYLRDRVQRLESRPAMSATPKTDEVMTHTRLRILKLLADNGGRLSYRELLVDGRTKSRSVTRPMVRAEWIGAEFVDGDWWFWITDAGRVMLEAYA